jgi:hypothetical protein
VSSIIEEHPQPLLFVVAAGNDAVDRCADEYVWPRKNRGGRNLYLHVGATEAYEVSGRVAEKFAEYSNFGSCVGALAPGGNTCAWMADKVQHFGVIQGTSFAAPVVSGLLAMAMAARRERVGASGAAAAVADLLGNQIAVSDVKEGTTKAFAALPLSMAGPVAPPRVPPGELPDPAQLKFSETLDSPPPSEAPSGLLAVIKSLSDAATWCFFAAFWSLVFAIIAVELSFWVVSTIFLLSVGAVISSGLVVLDLLREILTSPTPRELLGRLAIVILLFISSLVFVTLMMRRAWRIATAVWRRWRAWREPAAVTAAPGATSRPVEEGFP